MVSTTETQLVLPSLESDMEVAPLALRETSLDMPEAQSPTLMIQGVLGELALEGEVAKIPGVVEEEEG